MKDFYGTGRRKEATARVRIRPGNGQIIVNGQPFEEYFPVVTTRLTALKPLHVTQTEGKFDIHVLVSGGGKSGQAGALSHGLARALLEYDASFRTVLRQHGLLTRDPRMVERKKYGQKKARKRFQFSKR
ncbi:MAG: 30S ribosomal protein S9 [Bacteroidota bacterium]|nr:30S ribosomal protein S9 [Candidatus Kapabacteria bacterium]MCS7302666.1 30S ribosomal protein S9 [Candidatus Kapabacteria bacterium]MCX7936174.1 30S ribosomal protein S9 [Chlorobiota bacterium]MDW8074932.1 30S ribosomal protein S9 [Bacteroidota bacterium]MDW8271571.1 30S ribosomal protein S9 [Bacteroidota bacterium]